MGAYKLPAFGSFFLNDIVDVSRADFLFAEVSPASFDLFLVHGVLWLIAGTGWEIVEPHEQFLISMVST